MLPARLQLLSTTVSRLLRRGARQALEKIMHKYRPEEMAVAFLHLTPAERSQLFDACPDDEYRADLLAEMELDIAAELVASLPRARDTEGARQKKGTGKKSRKPQRAAPEREQRGKQKSKPQGKPERKQKGKQGPNLRQG